MFAQLKGYLIYMVYGLLIFFFVVVTPGILRSIFYGDDAVAAKRYDRATLQKVDKTIAAFNWMASPLGKYDQGKEGESVIGEMAVTLLIYMLVALAIAMFFNKVILPNKPKPKPFRKL
jgi:hypothetical protein